jgi:hypothetical protein
VDAGKTIDNQWNDDLDLTKWSDLEFEACAKSKQPEDRPELNSKELKP